MSSKQAFSLNPYQNFQKQQKFSPLFLWISQSKESSKINPKKIIIIKKKKKNKKIEK
jgi:hypothetical protein